MKEITLEATAENIPVVTEFVNDLLEKAGCPPKARMQIDVAIDEIFSNIAHYAYAPHTGMATVQVEAGGEPCAAVLTFVDSGAPHDPLARETPDIHAPLGQRPIGGLGIFLVKQMMDDVRYERRSAHNVLTVVKFF